MENQASRISKALSERIYDCPFEGMAFLAKSIMVMHGRACSKADISSLSNATFIAISFPAAVSLTLDSAQILTCQPEKRERRGPDPRQQQVFHPRSDRGGEAGAVEQVCGRDVRLDALISIIFCLGVII